MSKNLTMLTMMVDEGHKEMLPELKRELKRRLDVQLINIDLYNILYESYFGDEEDD